MRSLCVWVVVASPALAAETLPANTPTYSKEVSRIIQKNCEVCHRKGQIGPFALASYDEARAFAPEIKRVAQARIMPPWQAVKGFGPEFRNQRRLSDTDIDTLARWVDNGAPQGDLKDLPPPVNYNDGWAFGTPDAIFTPEVSFEVEPSGADEYRCFVMPTNYDEDRAIQGIDIRPSNRKVVHHVLIYTDVTGKARQLDEADPRPGFSCFGGLGFQAQNNLGGWAPGGLPGKLPDGFGRYLGKGADIVMQVHYHKNGGSETDRTSLGVYFSRQPVKKWVRLMPVANLGIRIPAGDANYCNTAKWTFNQDVLALSVAPHMHLLGKEMTMTATFPEGPTKELVWVKPWDFKWQTSFVFKEPIPMPKGTRIDVKACYDNSESNPSNPNKPLREVRWGDATTDEMLIGWIAYAVDKPVLVAR